MTDAAAVVDPWFLEHLVCPRDHGRLRLEGASLACAGGHAYPVVDGVPVMLIAESPDALGLGAASLRRAEGGAGDPRAPGLYLESLGISEAEKDGVAALARRDPPVDPVVAYLVAATNGMMYRNLIGDLQEYPLPRISLPPGHGRRLLDVGCSWGRWTLAAALIGYEAVGVDPSLGAVMAARRVARQLGVPARFVVGDARCLPFAPGAFDCVYSYSVIQHFSRADAARAVGEMGRLLKSGGVARVQMPTRVGLRGLYHRSRRRFRDGEGFEVRYWSLPELRRLFTDRIGPTAFSVDCFFGIGLQESDRRFMTPVRARLLDLSSALKAMSRAVPVLVRAADSVFVQATKAS